MIKSVLDGGDGCDRGGRLDRSRDKEGFVDVEEEDREERVDDPEWFSAAALPVVMLAVLTFGSN